MPVNLKSPIQSELYPIEGIRLGVAEAGIRKANRKDLTVIVLDEGASVAGVFTQNRFCAAPVQICREHLTAAGAIRALQEAAGLHSRLGVALRDGELERHLAVHADRRPDLSLSRPAVGRAQPALRDAGPQPRHPVAAYAGRRTAFPLLTPPDVEQAAGGSPS